MTITWDTVNEGDGIPELRKQPDLTQLVKFAAGNGDFNPLHHDFKFMACEYLGSVLVQGHYRYAALGEMLMNWLGHQGARVRKISCQHRGMDFPGAEIICKGIVDRKYEENGGKFADLTIWTETSEGAQNSPGKATIQFR
jgi:acyl dehydratase